MDRDFVKVLDFGVARIEHDVRITGQNMIVGTPEYIAPEQIRSLGTTPASDLYSLGCVLFEMLTGRIPFEGKTTVLLVKHINDPPPLPSKLNPALPREIDGMVLRLVLKLQEVGVGVGHVLDRRDHAHHPGRHPLGQADGGEAVQRPEVR